MSAPILSVRDLAVHFATRAGIVRAVDGVNFDVRSGETLGLVGESGCGKSTLGRAIVGLIKPKRGSIKLDNVEIAGLSRQAMRPHRSRVQIIFQDPFASLNPRLTVGRIIEEPLIVHRLGDRAARRAWVIGLMERVGLRPDWAARHPHEFSGGQRQRVGIARALALSPQLLICDEPVSALDVSVQAQVINLLADLQREQGLSYLFISHDLSLMQHIADRVVVMYVGKILEVADRRRIWSQPLHPYTRGLLEAIPVPDPDAALRPPRRLLSGEIADPLEPPSGCRFRTRCPYATEICATREPPLEQRDGGHAVACHHVDRIAGDATPNPGFSADAAVPS